MLRKYLYFSDKIYYNRDENEKKRTIKQFKKYM